MTRVSSELAHTFSMSDHLVELSEENKHELLSEGIRDSLAQQDQAEAILQELRRLNPTIARDFGLKSLALQQLKLRMLCYPDHGQKVDRVPSYLIISYCWHKPDWPANPEAPRVAADWEIYEPMAEKILNLRQSSDEGVWLDKLCIRQNPEDTEEKRVAIGSMDVVYRSARRMLILLEDVQLEESEYMVGKLFAEMYEELSTAVHENKLEGDAKAAFVSTFSQSKTQEIQTEMASRGYEANPELGRFLMKVLSARWFTRAWCAHESRVVPHLKHNNPLFLCFAPKAEIATFEFRAVVFFAFGCYRPVQPEAVAQTKTGREDEMRERTKDLDPTSFYDKRAQLVRLHGNSNDGGFLMQHLVMVANMGCEFKQDLLSIALNTAAIPLTFHGSLASPNDIFWIFSALSIASGDAGPLALSGQKLHTTERSDGRELVSWVEIPVSEPLDKQCRIVSPQSISHVGKEYIELDLLLVRQMPAKPSVEAMDGAASLIEKHGLRALGEDFAREADETTKALMQTMSRGTHHASSNRLLDMFLRTMVAFALDNGLAWVTRFCTVMPDDWESSWSWGNFRGYDERLTEAGVDLTICLGGTGDSTQVEAVVQYLSRILDSRMKFLTTSPRRMQVAEDDWCLTALASNRSWIAVPGAAADLAYPTKRAWVLEPFEFVDGPEKLEKVYESGAPLLSSDHEPARTPLELIGGSWRLRKRQVVYGCQNIVADGVHVLRLPRQRVYGAEDYDWEASQGVQREDFGQDSGS